MATPPATTSTAHPRAITPKSSEAKKKFIPIDKLLSASPSHQGILATDLYRLTFSNLSPKELLKCRLVCQLWKRIAEQIPRRPGGMLSIADQFSLRSLRQALTTSPQKEELLAQGFVPSKGGLTPNEYLRQAGFQISEVHAEGLHLQVQNAATREILGIIDLSDQPPSYILEETYLLSRFSSVELAEKYVGCYACPNNELITLFEDGTVFYWKKIEGQFVRIKVLRLDKIDHLRKENIYQWKHFLLVYTSNFGNRCQLHVYDLSNHCQRPSISPLDRPIDSSHLDLCCHAADPTRLVIGIHTLVSDIVFSPFFPAELYYLTLDETLAIKLKTINLEYLLQSKISKLHLSEKVNSFSTRDLTFTNHGFVFRLGLRFLFVLNQTLNEEWVVDLRHDLPMAFAIEADQEDSLLFLRLFYDLNQRPSFELLNLKQENLPQCFMGQRKYSVKTMMIHLPSEENLPIEKIDRLTGPSLKSEWTTPPNFTDFFPHLQNIHFFSDRQIMQLVLANQAKTIRLEYNLGIPKPKAGPFMNSIWKTASLLWGYLTFPFRWILGNIWNRLAR